MGMEQSVPLFSAQLGEGLIFAGVLWSIFLRIILYLLGVGIDIFLWLILTSLAGSLLLITWSLIKRRRFRNPITDSDLIDLFEEVKGDLGEGNDIELWSRDIDRQVFLSSCDLFFKAILFSGSAIADILERPEKGKILLAKAVLEIEKKRPIIRFLLGVLGFTIFSLIESVTFFDYFELFSFTFGLGLTLNVVIAFVVFLVIAIALISSRRKDVEKTVEQIYGSPPDIAKLEVFSGMTLTDEMRQETKQKEEERPSRKSIALRHAVISLFIVIPIAFLIFMFSGFITVLKVEFSLLMASVIGAFVFVMVYMTSFMWPLLMIGRGERSTEWDVQIPLAEEVQAFLYSHMDDKNLMVKGVKPPFDNDAGLFVLHLRPNFTEEVLYAAMPEMLRVLKDPELIGTLILAELKRKEVEKKEKRISYAVLGIGLPFLIISIIWLLVTSSLNGLLENFLSVLFIYFLIAFVPLGGTALWKRKTLLNAEVEIARQYPRYIDALGILVKTHHTLPYGMTSYKTRLERINRSLETRTDKTHPMKIHDYTSE